MKTNELQRLIVDFSSLQGDQQQKFILSTTKNDLALICEIVLNYLKNKLDNTYIITRKLKKFKDFIRNIVKKSLSASKKRVLLASIKGIYILRNIFPLALEKIRQITHND